MLLYPIHKTDHNQMFQDHIMGVRFASKLMVTKADPLNTGAFHGTARRNH